ncbi:MAG: hypothetical protein ABIG45_08360 [Bacillota bacterium]
MRKIFGGLPPRYGDLFKLALAMALFWLVSLIPFFLAFFLPLGPWFKIIAVFSPVLWVKVVCPARIRYGELMAAFARDGSAPLNPRNLLIQKQSWRGVCRGRVELVRWPALPFCTLAILLLLMLIFLNPFSALRIILEVFTWIATALGTIAAFLPRLMAGEPPVAQASVLAGVITLAAMLFISFCLFLWGLFRTSAYRFGYPGMPRGSDMRKLLKNNLFLWMPTLALLLSLFLLSYGEIGLIIANVLSVGPVFSVKPQLLQLALAALAAVSYMVFLPLRKLNTAIWATASP